MIDAGSRAAKKKGWVSSIDVLVGLGWLTPENVAACRRGQVPFLERVVSAGLGRVSTAMRERELAEHEEGAREPLVFVPQRESRCDKCQKELPRGAFIRLHDSRAECMTCAGYEDLLYLPAGDPTMTRRARAASERYAIVMKWSRARERYERQGILVQRDALTTAANSVGRADWLLLIDDSDSATSGQGRPGRPPAVHRGGQSSPDTASRAASRGMTYRTPRGRPARDLPMRIGR